MKRHSAAVASIRRHSGELGDTRPRWPRIRAASSGTDCGGGEPNPGANAAQLLA
jgi:hypothetical protein